LRGNDDAVGHGNELVAPVARVAFGCDAVEYEIDVAVRPRGLAVYHLGKVVGTADSMHPVHRFQPRCDGRVGGIDVKG